MVSIKIFKYIALFFGWVEMICFSGIMFGLNSLYDALKKENVFGYLCNTTSTLNETHRNSTKPCGIQNRYFGYILITVMTSQCVLAPLLGFLFDKYGRKISKTIGAISFFLSCVLFSLSCLFSHVLSFLVYFSAIFFGISIQIFLVCNLSLGKLFPKYQNLIISLLCGSLDSSSVMMTLFALTYISGIRLWVSFIILGIFGLVITLTSSLWILKYVEKFLNLNYENVVEKRIPEIKNTDHLSNENGNHINLEEVELIVEKNQSLDAQIADQKYKNLKSILLSRWYLFQLGYFSIMYFRFSYFLAQIGLQITFNFYDVSALADRLLSELNYFLICGILVSPIPGFIIDFSKKLLLTKTKKLTEASQIYNSTMRCFIFPQLILCVTNLLLSVTIILPNVPSVYITYLCLTISRSFLFSLNAAYLFQAFPGKYFGNLLGITIHIAGLISFIQYALLFNDIHSLNVVNYVLIALSCLTFIHPLTLAFVKD